MPEFPCPNPITVDLRIAGGNVDLLAEPRDTALVEVSPYDDSAACREAAEQTRVELSGDKLVIAAPESSGWAIRWRSARIRVSVRVPALSQGRLKSASADLSCRGQWAQLNLATASGDANLETVTGDLTVNTASGDVQVEQVGGQLTIKSASGDVTARQVTGPVDIKTASGDLQVDEASSDVSAKTASGDVRVGAARQGTVQTTTVSGDVSVGVVSGTAVWLDLNSVSGQTRSDLTVGGQSAPTNHQLTIRARAVSGNVEVHRVTPATGQPAASTSS